MAEFEENHRSSEQIHITPETQLERLKRDLEGWREILLPLNKVLEWEKPHYPGILVGIITFIFAIIWYWEPSVLTTFSLFGVIVCLIDFLVPTLSAYIFSTDNWTIIQERQYESICIRILNARNHILNLKNALLILKDDKPKVYLVIMMGFFAVLAWIGSLIDNLLLTYLMVVFLVLVPGLRCHGLLQKVTTNVTLVLKRLIMGKERKPKKTQ